MGVLVPNGQELAGRLSFPIRVRTGHYVLSRPFLRRLHVCTQQMLFPVHSCKNKTRNADTVGAMSPPPTKHFDLVWWLWEQSLENINPAGELGEHDPPSLWKPWNIEIYIDLHIYIGLHCTKVQWFGSLLHKQTGLGDLWNRVTKIWSVCGSAFRLRG